MYLSYFYSNIWKKHLFVFLNKLPELLCIWFDCFWAVQRWICKKKCLGKFKKVQRGPKGSLTPFHRVSPSLAVEKPHSWASTRSLQGFYMMSAIFYRTSGIFYRMFRDEVFGGWMERERWRSECGGMVRVGDGLELGGWSCGQVWMAVFGLKKTKAMLHTKLGLWERMVNRRQGF